MTTNYYVVYYFLEEKKDQNLKVWLKSLRGTHTKKTYNPFPINPMSHCKIIYTRLCMKFWILFNKVETI